MQINAKKMASDLVSKLSGPKEDNVVELDPNQGLETAADALMSALHSKSGPAVVQALKDFMDQYQSQPEAEPEPESGD